MQLFFLIEQCGYNTSLPLIKTLPILHLSSGWPLSLAQHKDRKLCTFLPDYFCHPGGK